MTHRQPVTDIYGLEHGGRAPGHENSIPDCSRHFTEVHMAGVNLALGIHYPHQWAFHLVISVPEGTKK
jgi:hypothetical protein